MNFREITEALSKLNEIDEVSAETIELDSSIASSDLAKALNDTVKRLRAQYVGDIKSYEVALQDTIERFYPGYAWWEITDCNIFWALFNKSPEEVVKEILFKIKPDFRPAPVVEEAVSMKKFDIDFIDKAEGNDIQKAVIKGTDIEDAKERFFAKDRNTECEIVSIKERKKVKECNTKKESLGSDITKYQRWVDYDMKRYGKISQRTMDTVKKAGLTINKNQYGDYEVIAHAPIEESKKPAKIVNEAVGDEIRIYMNTWANYNENGADLSQYGINSIADGWLTVDEALKFAEEHAEDEPFINDTDNVPFKVDEYDNAVQVLERLKELEDSDVDMDIVGLIVDELGYDFDDAVRIVENGDYQYYPDVTDAEDLGRTFIDELGGIKEAVSQDTVLSYIDRKQIENDFEYDVKNYLYDNAKERIADEEDIDEDDVTEEMIDNYVDDNWEDELDAQVDEYMDMIERGEVDGTDYFDYEKFGRDLTYEGFTITDKGAIEVY